MSKGKILDWGDPPEHEHFQSLPAVPSRRVTFADGRSREVDLENAIARCTCGELFVSKGHSGSLTEKIWVPLRWWHRTAQKKLREMEPDSE